MCAAGTRASSVPVLCPCPLGPWQVVPRVGLAACAKRSVLVGRDWEHWDAATQGCGIRTEQGWVQQSTILILKMYVVAIITGQVRLRKKAFANPEDALRNGGLQYYREDPDVERCRRAHRNDMENIFPFLFLGAVYSLLEPSPAVARVHFFIFCVGRIVHTVAYLLRLRAPTRSVAYGVAQLPCFSMALQILLVAAPYW
ncbi:prostaglandin E synthase isoform X3 [Numida meleagris]|uniref:prostaglandin E synthase isoform X3 n=1 Tax=Numida meleagris TaxID=8996 RepID=UPI000B3DFD8A|nr:prostaglandin E synthase isoform X3 [Numida meleagris]